MELAPRSSIFDWLGGILVMVNPRVPFDASRLASTNDVAWFTPPGQVVQEFLCSLLFLLVPLLLLFMRRVWHVSMPAASKLWEQKDIWHYVEVFATGVAWFCGVLTFIYKFAIPGRWVFLLQPCHLSNIVLMLLSGEHFLRTHSLGSFATGSSSSESPPWTHILLNWHVSMLFSAAIALATPDTSNSTMFFEIPYFYIQHVTLLVLPLVWIQRRRFHLYGGVGPFLLLWGFNFFFLHYIVFFGMGLVFEKNVNYMFVPPRPLVALLSPHPLLLRYYRTVMGLLCLVLTMLSRFVVVELWLRLTAPKRVHSSSSSEHKLLAGKGA
jgi:hypothetical protein